MLSNACATRTKIDQCSKHMPTEQKCLTCNDGYHLTTDLLACKAVLPNCSVYQASTKATTTLKCEKCALKFFVDAAGACEQGAIANCNEYSSQTVCAQCLSGFYWHSTATCKEHSSVPSNCKSTSYTTNGLCEICNPVHLLVKASKQCLAITAITSCDAYSSPTDCTLCKEGFEKVGTTCTAITTPNCLKKTGAACTKCKQGYYLKNAACETPLVWDSAYCATHNLDGLSTFFQCTACASGSTPYNFTNKAICTETSTFTPIANCLKHYFQGTTLRCSLCKPTFILSADEASCAATCSDTVFLMAYEHSGTKMANMRHKQCKSFEAGCELASLDVRTLDPVCIKCKSGFLARRACASELSLFPSSVNPDSTPTDLGKAYTTVDCEAIPSNPVYHPTTDPNCELWKKVGSEYYCDKCKWGFTGPIETHGTNHYVNCKNSVNNCSNDAVYGGAGFDINADEFWGFAFPNHYTCHKCAIDGMIPFLFLANAGGLLPYALTTGSDTPSKDTGTKTGELVQCLAPTKESFAMSATQWVGAFIAHCGLGALLVDVTKRSEAGKPPLYCLACAPGYKPTLTADLIITACVAIPKCDLTKTQTWFNNCETCNANTSYSYASGHVDFAACVDTALKHCLAFDTTGCRVCDKGFLLNSAKGCDALEHSQCSDLNFLQDLAFTTGAYHQGFLYQYLSPKGAGCSACIQATLLPLASVSSHWSCLSHTYVATSSLAQLTTDSHVPSCKHYGVVADAVLCVECEVGLIISNDGKQCVAATTTVAFCVQVDKDTIAECLKCATGYLLIKKECVNLNLANCQSYIVKSDNLACSKCNQGYYLTNDACKKGAITDCQEYNNQGYCLRCADDFALASIKNDKDNYCMKLAPETHCLHGVIDSTNNFTCSACKPDFILPTSSSTHNYCFPYQVVLKCKTYHNDFLSGFACSACLQGYYLTNNTCTAYTIKEDGCLTLDPLKDACKVCEASFLLNTTMTCTKNPVGLSNCSVYVSESECKVCDTLFYLTAPTCTAVKVKVEFCKVYSGDGVCSACAEGYLISLDKCALIKAQNCKEYTDVNSCKSCNDGFQLKTNATSGFLECLDVNLLNCEIYSGSACLECKQGYYLTTDKVCQGVSQFVSNCESYDTATTC